MGKKPPVRRVAPNTGTKGRGKPVRLRNELDELSDMEKLSIQLDVANDVPKAVLAKKWGLSTRQVTQVVKMKLSSPAVRDRLERTAARLLEQAHAAMDSVDEKKLDKANLAQLGIFSGISIDKALAIDKHLHGSQDHQGDLILSFGSREQLEKAILKKYKDNPLFKRVDADAKIRDVQDAEVVSVGEQSSTGEQLSLFAGKEESPRPPLDTQFDTRGKEEIAPGVWRNKSVSKEDSAKDAQIEESIDNSWSDVRSTSDSDV